MALPSDRPSLLSLAIETQHVVDQTADGGDSEDAQKHANELFRLGEIRVRLEETPEAERLFDQAARAFSKLDTALNREWAAYSRIRQAGLVGSDERWDEALAILDQLVQERGGFPEFDVLSDARPGGLDLWMLLLSEQKDYERLYDAASTSLSLLDPTGPAKQRIVIARAMAARAAAARALGRNEEAIDMYEQAIALYEAEDPELLRGSEQADAFGDLAALLSDLGREREALALNARMLGAHAKRAKRAVRRKFGPKRTKSD